MIFRLSHAAALAINLIVQVHRLFGAAIQMLPGIALCATVGASANTLPAKYPRQGEAAKPFALSIGADYDAVGIRVFPSVAGPGVRRFLMTYGNPNGRISGAGVCSGPMQREFDRSKLTTEALLLLRELNVLQSCSQPLPPLSLPGIPVTTFAFTPEGPGSIRFQWIQSVTLGFSPPQSPQTVPMVAIETSVGRIGSFANVSGMWFDQATNGSGIAMHHGAASDNVFGTLFLFSDTGVPRWYTVQYVYWINGGRSLEGLLLPQARGGCTDTQLVACPSIGTTAPQFAYDVGRLSQPLREPPLVGAYGIGPAYSFFEKDHFVRMDFLPGDLARIEITDVTGAVIHSATLMRLRH